MDRVLEHLYVHGVPSTESAVFHDWQEMNMRDRTPFYPVEPSMTFGVEYFGGDGLYDACDGYIDDLSNVPDIDEDDGYEYLGDRYSRCDYDYARADLSPANGVTYVYGSYAHSYSGWADGSADADDPGGGDGWGDGSSRYSVMGGDGDGAGPAVDAHEGSPAGVSYDNGRIVCMDEESP